ncbi:PREDICTED: uncharacterized protein LOC108779800 [Cyphomyrmex costatus]|uniref:uncharacterized protein LOC108779800 n=1 Tax=Cyphomyrmex costatus TaxID=456900 RepID=UPI0008522964|nr:PREDICTED: uncharacterized protein LOC108779800 [Cyphomyrmex costatus]
MHKAGKRNTNADALSRNPICNIKKDEENEEDKEKTMREYTEEEKQRILYEYHDSPTGGHQGVTRTLNRIRLTHNWRGITRDVENYISKCENCQKNKLSRKTKMPLEITDTPIKPFEKCALDIVGPLTVTTAGDKYILTFQDNLTKFSKAIPIANQEAATVAKAFVTRIIVEYGIPEKILTDQVYGREATLPTSLTTPPKPSYTYDDYAQELKERLRATNQIAREHIKEEKIKAKEYHDKKAKEIKFKIGDKVLLYDETLRRGRSKKLDALWTRDPMNNKPKMHNNPCEII